MKILVVYDSLYGNTARIAEAIGGSVGGLGEVEVVRAERVAPTSLLGLAALFVGSPTRGFRPTPVVSKLLEGMQPHALAGVKVAAFDTRIPENRMPSFLRVLVRLFGYAATPIAALLQNRGGTLVRPPEGFLVEGREGPLAQGEEARAAAWAKEVVA